MNQSYGMDPELAKVAMAKIQDLKRNLSTEINSAGTEINQKVVTAFPGTQSGSMQNFVTSLTSALDDLYTYLDGNESSFAKVFEGTIASYIQSDENVAASYNVTE